MLNNSFQDPGLSHKILNQISEYKKELRIMEVCGSHTMAIGKWALRKLLPPNIQLISGPGCPVCVTPVSYIDALISLKSLTITVFGDLLRLPGSLTTLETARAQGLDVRLVFSPLDALKIAQKQETVFAGIGFETTTPGIAHTIRLAQENNITNFSVLPAFKLIPPALKYLLLADDVEIDAFLLPGHVSAIIGSNAYSFLPAQFDTSGVISGFEPLDILLAIKMIIDILESGKNAIENEYQRVVSPSGNLQAQNIMNQVLYPRDACWRGLGIIPASGLAIKPEFSRFDATQKYDLDISYYEPPSPCRCADILKGKILPPQCPLFADSCSPAHPIGPCMVSSEGSCAAYYKYER
ncbi:MAG: hydrogenase formation protein HypD [Candidatus Cloacimonetes bacterium]|nr:hydrogenase formation protein HypD [Candidatus Cloacimonadota bacterium]